MCATQMRELGWVSAFLRGVMAQEMTASGIASRHRTMIRMIWTANGMGERYFNALDPGVSYSKFESMVTDFVCQAAAEGWIRVIMPPSPLDASDGAYKLEIDDEDRFVTEMSLLFTQESTTSGR